MSSKKESKGQEGLGDFMEPIIELIGFIAIFVLFKVIGEGIPWLVKRYFVYRDKKHELKKIERNDLKNNKQTSDYNTIGYSVTHKRALPFAELDRAKHTLVVGASGFGKTALFDVLMSGDAKADKPIIFIDPKGNNETLEQFVSICRLLGREYQIFSEYYTGVGRVSLNPAKDGSATQIADRIHYAFNWSDEHYETMCYRGLKRAVTLLIEDEASGEITFSLILEKLLDISNPRNKKRLFDRKNIEGIIARLENIVESDFGSHLGADGVSFKEVWDSKKCLYVGLPVLGYPHVARELGKMILGDLAYAVYETYKTQTIFSKKHLTPIGIFIDELSAVITDEFIELLNKCRGVKMELTIAFQSISDITKLSPELADQLLENTSNWFILKQRVEGGAEVFSASIGTMTGKKKTVRVEGNQEQELGSQRAVEELIVHNNIIKNLKTGQSILLRHDPTQVDLINLRFVDPEDVASEVEFCEDLDFIAPLPKLSVARPMPTQVIPISTKTEAAKPKENIL